MSKHREHIEENKALRFELDEARAADDHIAALEKVVKSVAGYHTDCCGLATKPEYACMHDAARAVLSKDTP